MSDLEKMDEKSRPSYEGEDHPDKPHVGKMHVDGRLAWYANKEHAAIHDKFINEHSQAFINKHPKEHRSIIRQFIDNAMSSKTRHAVPAGDKNPSDLKVRARHIKSLIQGHDHINMGVTQSGNKLFLTAIRHGQQGSTPTKPRIDAWSFSKEGDLKVEKTEHNLEGFYENDDNDSGLRKIVYLGRVELSGADDGREALRKAWVLPAIAGRVLHFSSKVRSLGLRKGSIGTNQDLGVSPDRGSAREGCLVLIPDGFEGVLQSSQDMPNTGFSKLGKTSPASNELSQSQILVNTNPPRGTSG